MIYGGSFKGRELLCIGALITAYELLVGVKHLNTSMTLWQTSFYFLGSSDYYH